MRLSIKDRKRFLSKILFQCFGPHTDCMIWSGARDKNGYGLFKLKRKMLKAHRVSWEMHRGSIPKGLLVCHRCDCPPCVKPEHLFIGSAKDNTQDMIRKGRKAPSKGELHSQSKITEYDVRLIRALWDQRVLSQSKIAKKFNITRSNVSAIVRNISWKHI